VSCPVYLSPATTETKRIRLNQINTETGNRLKQQLVDSETGKVVERHQVAKGYEHDRGQYVLITDEELQGLQVESSKVILTRFVDRDEVDPVYLDAPYYVYPDGQLAVEAFQIIGQAMAARVSPASAR
jgi:DNA end-binding protein Ku